MRKKRKTAKGRRPRGAPTARLPLPKKGESRHGDRTKYERAREKARLDRESRVPGGDA
jgi:hypothetical protein